LFGTSMDGLASLVLDAVSWARGGSPRVATRS
jgi:hypothetical protein